MTMYQRDGIMGSWSFYTRNPLSRQAIRQNEPVGEKPSHLPSAHVSLTLSGPLNGFALCPLPDFSWGVRRLAWVMSCS